MAGKQRILWLRVLGITQRRADNGKARSETHVETYIETYIGSIAVQKKKCKGRDEIS
ncbi:MAG: hypothetical protein KKD18_00450 [Nanoarchaeota archaeon]|nr:hypothetical protein [Nanoarchaeota archaeon]